MVQRFPAMGFATRKIEFRNELPRQKHPEPAMMKLFEL
jgi:hypothetical protein